MSRSLVIVALPLLVGFMAVVEGAEPVKFDKSQLVGGDVPSHYRPNYPMEARGGHQTGSGIFILHVDAKTGEVASTTVQKSTGYYLLDGSVLRACKHWRFRPGTVTEVSLPITFSMRGAIIQEWGPHGAR